MSFPSPADENTHPPARSRRGFASMDREKHRQIAKMGGQAAHARGAAHEFDSAEAVIAGRKGGLSISQNREHMAAIGQRGGKARHACAEPGCSFPRHTGSLRCAQHLGGDQ